MASSDTTYASSRSTSIDDDLTKYDDIITADVGSGHEKYFDTEQGIFDNMNFVNFNPKNGLKITKLLYKGKLFWRSKDSPVVQTSILYDSGHPSLLYVEHDTFEYFTLNDKDTWEPLEEEEYRIKVDRIRSSVKIKDVIPIDFTEARAKMNEALIIFSKEEKFTIKLDLGYQSKSVKDGTKLIWESRRTYERCTFVSGCLKNYCIYLCRLTIKGKELFPDIVQFKNSGAKWVPVDDETYEYDFDMLKPDKDGTQCNERVCKGTVKREPVALYTKSKSI